MSANARWLLPGGSSTLPQSCLASRGRVTQPAFAGRDPVPACLVLQVVELVKRWSITPPELLGRLGLREPDLQASGASLPLGSYIEVLDRARALTSEPG